MGIGKLTIPLRDNNCSNEERWPGAFWQIPVLQGRASVGAALSASFGSDIISFDTNRNHEDKEQQ